MQVKKHKALDRRNQRSKRLTPDTYTRGNMRRIETTWGRDNRNQAPRNQRISLRPEITFKAHIAYTQTKTLSKPGVVSMVKRRATRDASSDENCNKMRKQRGKGRQNKITKLCRCPRAMKESIEVRSPKTRSWKPRRTRTIDGKPTTRKTTLKTTKIWPGPRRWSS